MLRVAALTCSLMCAALAAPARAQDADALRARHASLRSQLDESPFGRPLAVRSGGTASAPRGEILAVLGQPFGRVGPALARIGNWCEILILQANVKHCRTSQDATAGTVSVFVGRTPQDRLEDTYRLDLAFDAAAHADYVHVSLHAPGGPLGTSDYRIRLEAAPLEEGRTFVRLAYSYRLGMAARTATGVYLATTGRHKKGFTVVGRQPDGRPTYVDGVRGMVERNAMRYYLAVETFVASLAVPEQERTEHRLSAWHAALERHPQLRELERDEYLRIKRRDLGLS